MSDGAEVESDLRVFPGAEGFGVATVAGRGGQVIKVQTLAKDGPGSLKAALDQQGPRIIVFEVAGTIGLDRSLNVSNPYVTIAAQTAPSPGITLAGAPLVVRTHDVLIQHLRVRVGDRTQVDPDNADALAISHPSAEVYNVVIDHCSFSWAIDEVLSTWGPKVHDVTISRSIVSEGLSHSIHPKGEHSKGILVGDHSKRVAVLGNYLAHNLQRNPLLKGDVTALVAYNLIYNPGNEPIHFTDPEGSGPTLATIVGNRVVPGPSSLANWPAIIIHADVKAGTKIFLADNAPSKSDDPWSAARVDVTFGVMASEPPVPFRRVTWRSADEMQLWVLKNAGARPADRDAVDARVVDDVANRSGRIIDSQDEVGGWPALGTQVRPLSLPEAPNADPDGDGYTNMDDWLHQRSREVEAP
jgi:hypothetical protein